MAVRSVAKGLIVDTLATTESARVPAQHAWDIATSLLQSIATSVVIFGVLFVIAAYLASPHSGAISIRQGARPHAPRPSRDRLVGLRRGRADRACSSGRPTGRASSSSPCC